MYETIVIGTAQQTRDMEQSGFIAVVELSTTKITGIVARKNAQGVITILASEIMPSDASVRYGIIYNIDLAAGKIKRLVSLLENKIGKKIGSIYVSVAGKSLRALEHSETKLLDENTTITMAMLDTMDQQAKLNKPDFFTNYSVHEPQYFVDGVYEENPIGKAASSVEARSIIVVGPPNIKANLKRSIEDKAQVQIKSYITGAVAAGALVVDFEDRQKGCALIDFGAGTTTVSIYKEGLLKFMTVIPFGGRTVTKDVQALGFSTEQAEEYKIKYGKLGKRTAQDEIDKPNDIDVRELNKVIQLRMDEIILNVLNQMKLSGHAEGLEAGVLTIGGASQIQGLNEYLAEKTQMEVRRATPKRVYINNAAELLHDPAYAQVLGLLLFANENCERIEEVAPPVVEQPKVVIEEPVLEPTSAPKSKKDKKKKDKKQGYLFDMFEKVSNFGGALFNDEEEDEE